MALARLALSTAAASLLLARLTLAQTCYFPNGTRAEEPYTVCNPSAEFSSCCGPDDECLTNGLCRPTNSAPDENDYWRDGCTDKTWEAPQCPKYCYEGSSAASMNAFVNSCSWNTYCCADTNLWVLGNYTCCNDADLVFTAGPAVYLSGPQVSISPLPQSTSSRVISTSSSVGAGAISTPSTHSTTSFTSTPTFSHISTKTQTTASISGAPLHGGKSNPDPNPSGGGLSSGDYAAIGVCVGVAVIAFVAFLAWFLLRRKRRNATQSNYEATDAMPQSPSMSQQQNRPVYAHYAPVPSESHEPQQDYYAPAYGEQKGSAMQQPVLQNPSELEGLRGLELEANGQRKQYLPTERAEME